MSPVEFKKKPCHTVEFKGEWPQVGGGGGVDPVSSTDTE